MTSADFGKNIHDLSRTSTYKSDVQLATTENRPLIRIEGWGIGRRVRVFLKHGQLTMCSIKVSGTPVTGERPGPHTAVQYNTHVLSRYRSSVTWSDDRQSVCLDATT